MVEGDESAHGAPQLRTRLDALGEPLRSGIPEGGAAPFVERFGMTLISDLQPDELAAALPAASGRHDRGPALRLLRTGSRPGRGRRASQAEGSRK